MAEKKEELERMISRLRHIDEHSAVYLLRNCIWMPKLQYLLRASPLFRHEELLQPLDGMLRAATSAITNVNFSDECWLQASLPTRYGGLGLRRTLDVALPSYIASLYRCMELVLAILPGEFHSSVPAECEQ